MKGESSKTRFYCQMEAHAWGSETGEDKDTLGEVEEKDGFQNKSYVEQIIRRTQIIEKVLSGWLSWFIGYCCGTIVYIGIGPY